MRRTRERLRRFFFPPSDTPTWEKVLPYALLGLITILALTAGAYTWDYTNSPRFCGTTCHTMPPEYTAYLTSPHARIDCVDCHIGKGFIATRITRKAGDLRHVFATTFKTYEFPIRAGDLRPARETCELCHYPGKFSDDTMKEIKRFSNDLVNTPKSIFLILKTGGGSKVQGLGKGIHWHIVNQVYFLPTDSEEQTIPYVKTVDDTGAVHEYVALDSGINPSQVDPTKLKQMDCITCHNRVTHLVYPPDDTVDQLITRGLISPSIPEIRRKSIEVYSQIYKTTQEGVNEIAGLTGYYKAYYADFYAANQGLIDQAIQALQQAYRQSVYPEQNSDWTTHPNNVGHKDSPGCFRCHDGKHLDSQQQAIRLECNLCHSIPVVSGPNDYVARVEVSRGPEPKSHLNQNWISQHHSAFDGACSKCHSTGNPGGSDNTSFCSNSACHASQWKFAGFNAPELRKIVLAQLPPTPTPQPLPSGGPLTYNDTVGPLLTARCGSCHSGSSSVQGLDLSTYASALAGGASGKAIVPGDPATSLLVQKQTASQAHFGQLDPAELGLVTQWIQAGAPEK